MSRHNHSKHWVDDVNNQRHDPIGLEEVWATKWWPTRQFTFLCSVAEVNAVNSRARGRKANTDPQLTFRRNLAVEMMENKIGINLPRPPSPVATRSKRKVVGHEKRKRPIHTGAWDNAKGTWKTTKTDYTKLLCSVCKTKCRTYCTCNPAVPLCERCYYDHEEEQKPQS